MRSIMADAVATAPTDISEDVCAMSRMEHIEQAMAALTVFGLGLDCETGYQALLVIVTVAQLLHGHAAYDPLPEAKILAERAQRMAAESEARANSQIFPAPDNGQVH